MKTKALINLTVAAFVFLNVLGAVTSNTVKQEPKYIIVDACGQVHVVKGTPKPTDQDTWKWDYTRICSWAQANANKYGR